MAIHVIRQGDHISAVARRYGFADWGTIWRHAENAELREKRPNPHVLSPGDRLFVPDLEAREESGDTTERHRFRVLGKDLKLRLRLLDFDNEPLRDTECDLHVSAERHRLHTDSDGFVEHVVPRDTKQVLLTFGDPEVPFESIVRIRVGDLDPVDEPSGQRQRLSNLGYPTGPLEVLDAAKLGVAVQEFQCDQGLVVDGICGRQTQASLLDVHGS